MARGTEVVARREAARTWFQVSLQTFGGPAGQIAVMHRELVERRRWIGEERFLHALSYCTLLPGPEAQQLAIYLGWLLNGTVGGLVAGVLFVLPGFVALMALSVLYVGWGDNRVVSALFAGIAPAVLAIVVHALWRVAGRALKNRLLVAIGSGAFLALFGLRYPFPLVIATAGLVGYAASRWRPDLFSPTVPKVGPPNEPAPLIADDALHGERPSWSRAGWILAVGIVLWVTPVLLAALVFGRSSVFVEQGRFFGGAALVTFGGAYAVLAYVAQRAVEVYGWLAPGEMVKGLALAETTPGPLIMVVQFVAFLGAYRDPGNLDPWLAGVLGATLVVWVTFVPCFLFVFLGAPHVESLRGNRRLTAALAGVTAAVVGVIANLAVYFAVHTLFATVEDERWGPFRLGVPMWSTFVPRAAAVTMLAFVLLFRARWSVLRVLGVCAVVGGALELAAT